MRLDGTNIVALSHIKTQQGVLRDHEGNVFDAISYSQAKYGKGDILTSWGRRLAHEARSHFQSQVFEPNPKTHLAVIAQDHKNIGPPSHVVSQAFVTEINLMRHSMGLQPASIVHIHSDHPVTKPYEKMTIEERKTHQSKPEVNSRLIRKRHVFFIDDARITGGLEEKMKQMLDPLGYLSLQFFYAVVADAEEARKNPKIEDAITHAYVTHPDKLDSIINSPDFVLARRICKYIMTHPDLHTIKRFIERQSDTFLYDIFTASINTNYATDPNNSANFKAIEYELRNRNVLDHDGEVLHSTRR